MGEEAEHWLDGRGSAERSWSTGRHHRHRRYASLLPPLSDAVLAAAAMPPSFTVIFRRPQSASLEIRPPSAAAPCNPFVNPLGGRPFTSPGPLWRPTSMVRESRPWPHEAVGRRPPPPLLSFSLVALVTTALLLPMTAAVINTGNPDAKRLYDDLLSNYNKLVRPVQNTTDPLTVRIKLKLSQLIDVVRSRYICIIILG
jgi:hypothetical protein